MSETFFAYDDAHGDENRLVAGIEYDIAAEIDEKNGWTEPGQPSEVEVTHTVRAADASNALSEFILFCFQGQKLDRRGKGLRTAIRRFVAICWMLKSNELVDPHGRPLSLERLASLPQVKCTKCTLSLLAQEFGKQWGFRVRVQKKETTKPNYAAAAKKGWKKRRLREERES